MLLTLTEQKILIHSLRPDVLTATAEALAAVRVSHVNAVLENVSSLTISCLFIEHISFQVAMSLHTTLSAWIE